MENTRPLQGNIFFHHMNLPREERFAYYKTFKLSSQTFRYN